MDSIPNVCRLLLRIYTLGCLVVSVCICSPSTVISGIVEEDVLLPCAIKYEDEFDLKKLVVNWQTENDTVVHSFFYGEDHPEYQGIIFQGRTQMFLQEFPKGNLSLLLKRLKHSDSGKYVCYVSIKNIHASWMDLYITDKETAISSRYYFIKVGSFISFALMLIGFLYIGKIKIRKKRSSAESEPLLRKNRKEYIEKYKEHVRRTSNSSSEEERGTNDFISRTLLIPEWRTMDMNFEKMDQNILLRRKRDTLPSEELFTKDNMVLSSKRMLLAGEAGIGKSFFSKGLQKKWAFRENCMHYECVMYFTFAELKAIKKPMSVKELLRNKCKDLEDVLPELLESGRLLIIFDGYDEFIVNTEKNALKNAIDNDTPLPIENLVLSILRKALLPNTDILVTSRLKSENVEKTGEYFERTFIMQEFTDDQIKQFYKKFCSDEISQSIYDFIEEHNLSSLVSIPLLSSALYELSKNQGLCSPNLQRLATRSEMMSSLLKVCLANALSYESESTEPCCVIKPQSTSSNLPSKVKIMVENMSELSYNNLLAGVEEINVQDLGEGCVHTQRLLECFSEFFFKQTSNTGLLQYRHTSIRDMFAALHCAWTICNSEGILECLNAWTWGNIPERQSRTHILLQNTNMNQNIVFDNFLNFFMGFFMYSNMDGLYTSGRNLQRVPYLEMYFEVWIKKEPSCAKLLHLFHCIYELQENRLTGHLSSMFTSVNLFNTSLNALDIRAMHYSLEKSKLEELDLTLCDLRNEHLNQLQTVIRNSTYVNLSSNMLTKESGLILRRILEHSDCEIKDLFLAVNKLGPSGVNNLWEALETNTSVEKLNVCDNELQDKGTENMVFSLCANKTLKKLILCMNNFNGIGMKNIKELMQKRRDLKVVIRITEDDEFFKYVKGQVDSLKSDGWKKYQKSWVHHILKIVQQDLRHVDHSKDVTLLKRSIRDIIQAMKCAEQKQVCMS
ncbi:NLRC3-like isoform X1 [Pelobates cultripes]|uniref:NLRC3-like isoform X1 n=1 Tax=Pelobates cultripes TaxID=61616 RepID=A0AAD1VVW2_PELCU|nr:NLRC3-like isoform X1 [Pelobates cultripes]